MSTLPKVTRLVLFKHGSAYLERQGPADARFDLTFPLADMSDVLKSLVVGVPDGSQRVTSIGYDAPRDPADELARRNLLFEPGTSVSGLLATAKGRSVALGSIDGGVVRGEVIGVDSTHTREGERRILALRSEGGRVELVDLAQVTSVNFVDEQTLDDLDYLIDRSRAMTTGQNRIVTVALTGPTADLHISYVVQAPVWRVSYRLVCSADCDITIVAMGIISNPVDEDLHDVELTLTTGRPATFDVDLFSERRMHRVTLDEVGETARPPTHFEQADEVSFITAGVDAAPPSPAGRAAPAPARSRVLAAMKSATVTDDRGEYFEYRLAEPVSLKRGTASMVPILTNTLTGARKERIWRPGAGSSPDMVIAFENTTGAVLEAGPVVIYDDGAYAGEAMLAFTPRGVTSRVGFGTDLAITCTDWTQFATVTTGIRIGKDLIEEQRQETSHEIRIVNSGRADTDVIVELPKSSGTEIRSGDGLHTPFETTESFHRFRVSAPTGSHATVSIVEYTLVSHRTSYTDLSADSLRRWLSSKVLDAATFAELSDVLAHLGRKGDLLDEIDTLTAERQSTLADQEHLTKQLTVLHSDGPEGEVRAATVANLVGLQSRVADIDEQVRNLRRDAAEADAAAAEALAQIGARQE